MTRVQSVYYFTFDGSWIIELFRLCLLLQQQQMDSVFYSSLPKRPAGKTDGLLPLWRYLKGAEKILCKKRTEIAKANLLLPSDLENNIFIGNQGVPNPCQMGDLVIACHPFQLGDYADYSWLAHNHLQIRNQMVTGCAKITSRKRKSKKYEFSKNFLNLAAFK